MGKRQNTEDVIERYLDRLETEINRFSYYKRCCKTFDI